MVWPVSTPSTTCAYLPRRVVGSGQRQLTPTAFERSSLQRSVDRARGRGCGPRCSMFRVDWCAFGGVASKSAFVTHLRITYTVLFQVRVVLAGEHDGIGAALAGGAAVARGTCGDARDGCHGLGASGGACDTHERRAATRHCSEPRFLCHPAPFGHSTLYRHLIIAC